MAVGWNKYGQCDVSAWSGIVAVAAGWRRTIGLKSDGTVLAVGRNKEGQCEVDDWSDIVAVSAGDWHTVGLRSDGTVVVAGNNSRGQSNVSGWREMVVVAAGYLHTVGVRADGTVAAVGSNLSGQCEVGGWRDIVAIAAGEPPHRGAPVGRQRGRCGMERVRPMQRGPVARDRGYRGRLCAHARAQGGRHRPRRGRQRARPVRGGRLARRPFAWGDMGAPSGLQQVQLIDFPAHPAEAAKHSDGGTQSRDQGEFGVGAEPVVPAGEDQPSFPRRGGERALQACGSIRDTGRAWRTPNAGLGGTEARSGCPDTRRERRRSTRRRSHRLAPPLHRVRMRGHEDAETLSGGHPPGILQVLPADRRERAPRREPGTLPRTPAFGRAVEPGGCKVEV